MYLFITTAAGAINSLMTGPSTALGILFLSRSSFLPGNRSRSSLLLIFYTAQQHHPAKSIVVRRGQEREREREG